MILTSVGPGLVIGVDVLQAIDVDVWLKVFACLRVETAEQDARRPPKSRAMITSWPRPCVRLGVLYEQDRGSAVLLASTHAARHLVVVELRLQDGLRWCLRSLAGVDLA